KESQEFEYDLNTEVIKDVAEETTLKCRKTSKTPKKKEIFLEHISVNKVRELLINQNSGNLEYVEGYLRINPNFYKHAYLNLPDEEPGLLIVGFGDRNRALEGDNVVARINPPEKWQVFSDGQKRKTGVIVSILEKIHPRKTIGYLKQEGACFDFYPRDKRVPLLRIDPKSLPKGFTVPEKETLFLASITRWVKPHLTLGRIVRKVGSAGEISAESSAILLERGLDVTPYNQEMIQSLPNRDYLLTENDIKDREDWRKECVFTIDPDTASDLDDAVSCKLLENENYEIGVHIADVTYYLEFSSPLDKQVQQRATTVYMTDNVYHMLPKQLCEICSLLPGQDRLAFSLIFEMTAEGKIVTYRFAKTIINSCCQMAYQHAQKFIESPKNNWPNDMLNIRGNYNVNDLSSKVNSLHNLATKMRNKRYASGALQIDQPKLFVTIDRTTGEPISYSIEENKESNRLIEEFMLLTNMIVANLLYNTIPETALLRNHKEPSKFVLSKIKDTLQKFGIHLDIESSGSLHASIKRYKEDLESESNDSKATMKYRMMVINNLCAKAMTRATYNCSSIFKTENELRHYALNVDFYTHFTSPIRRYADCVVHRLLHSIIKNEALPKEWSEQLCMKIAANCNLKKYNAKLAQEQSSELYLTYLVNLNGPFVTMGIVTDVKETNMDVILCQMGIKLRIHLENLKDVAKVEYSTECTVPNLSIRWNQHAAVTQVINDAVKP
ncbi:DIS3-like exonuclease 2, partial [Dufourea novaeangliae]